MTKPQWATAPGHIGTATEFTTALFTISAYFATSYSIISGEIPPGFILAPNGNISGTSEKVGEDLSYTFVARASNASGSRDRTFSIQIKNTNGPVWTTPEGLLPVGPYGQNYAINYESVEYQLHATYDNLPQGQLLRFYIDEFDGELPPGLTLTETGKIVGIVKDTLGVDMSASNIAGYDADSNDTTPYDHSGAPPASYVPKIYQFTVSATDGVSTAKRYFYIKVEHPTNLQSETSYASADTVIYSADAAKELINPTWLTPIDLGVIRGNNTQIIPLSMYDPYPSDGETYYYSDIVVRSGATATAGISTTLTTYNIAGNSQLFVSNPTSGVGVGSYFQLNGYVKDASETVYRVILVSPTTGGLNLQLGVDTNYLGVLMSRDYLPTSGNKLGDMYMIHLTQEYWVYRSDIDAFEQHSSAISYIPWHLEDTVKNGTLIYFGARSKLPPNFKLDKTQGLLYASLPYQAQYNTSYSFAISIVKKDVETGYISYYHPRTFRLTIRGEAESTLAFDTSSFLGNLTIGHTSEIMIVANHAVASISSIKYKLPAGSSLPPGLTLTQDGAISGTVDFGTPPGLYTFNVEATDIYNQNYVGQMFYINVVKDSNLQFTKIYVAPFLNTTTRRAYSDLMTDQYVFKRELIYRANDPAFGVQHNIKLYLEHGIQKIELDQYFPDITKYFYNKRFLLGDVKVNKAVDSNRTHVYDIVYVEVIDPLKAIGTKSTVGPIDFGFLKAYPNSVVNMKTVLEGINVDNVPVEVDEYLQPRYMRTAQTDGSPLGFILALPLCYATPGNGETIASRIRAYGFDFKSINFEVDRLMIEDELTDLATRYIIFPNKTISTTIPEPAPVPPPPLNLFAILAETGEVIYAEDNVGLFTENYQP